VPIPSAASNRGNSGLRRLAAAGSSRAAAAAAPSAGCEDSGCSDANCGSPASAAVAAAALCYRCEFSSSFPAATQPGPWLATGSSPRFEVMNRRAGGSAAAAAADGEAAAAGAVGASAVQAAAAGLCDGPGSISN
jgi:hypothetical protein